MSGSMKSRGLLELQARCIEFGSKHAEGEADVCGNVWVLMYRCPRQLVFHGLPKYVSDCRY